MGFHPVRYWRSQTTTNHKSEGTGWNPMLRRQTPCCRLKNMWSTISSCSYSMNPDTLKTCPTKFNRLLTAGASDGRSVGYSRSRLKVPTLRDGESLFSSLSSPTKVAGTLRVPSAGT